MGMKGAQRRRSIGDDEYLYVKLVGEALETLLMATTYHFLILYFAPSMADLTGHQAGREGNEEEWIDTKYNLIHLLHDLMFVLFTS